MNPVDQILPSSGVKLSEVAKRLGMTSKQVSNLIDKGDLKSIVVGGEKRKHRVTTWPWVAAYLNRKNPDLRRY